MSEWIAFRLLSGEAVETVETAETVMDWGQVGSTVVTGIVVVFLILAILVGVLSLMGMILGKKKKTAPPAEKPAAPAPAVKKIEEAPAETYEDGGEIIAVISAAVAAYGEAEGKRYRITGVKKREKTARSGWSAAGIAENTRGF